MEKNGDPHYEAAARAADMWQDANVARQLLKNHGEVQWPTPLWQDAVEAVERSLAFLEAARAADAQDVQVLAGGSRPHLARPRLVASQGHGRFRIAL